MSRWWCPWLLPVILLGSVILVSRPILCGAWLGACTLAARGINASVARLQARADLGIAPGTDAYLR
jgi:hypothetical protein